MKIGIMGGTFDPIHIGHLLLGEFAYEDFGLDEIWFLPNGNPPHKETADTGTSLEHRIEMIRKAIEGVPHFRLNLHEANTEEHSYTYRTMQEFNQMFPEHEFYFILEQILCFLLNSGNISGRFFRPARFWLPCGMIKMPGKCSARFCI